MDSPLRPLVANVHTRSDRHPPQVGITAESYLPLGQDPEALDHRHDGM
jgi:hypothetical protein